MIHGGKRTSALAKISPLDSWLNVVGDFERKYDHPNGHCGCLKYWSEIDACANADFSVRAREIVEQKNSMMIRAQLIEMSS